MCFGAQVLAWSLDAPVGKAPTREVGFEGPCSSPRRRPIRCSPTTATGTRFQWHMDTFEPPTGASCSPRATGSVTRPSASANEPGASSATSRSTSPSSESWLDIFATEGDLFTEWGKSDEEVRAEADTFMAGHEQRGRELFTRFAEQSRSERGLTESYRPLVAVVGYHLAPGRVTRWPDGGYGVPGPYLDALRRSGARTSS